MNNLLKLPGIYEAFHKARITKMFAITVTMENVTFKIQIVVMNAP